MALAIPVSVRSGDLAAWVDRKGPSGVRIREIECRKHAPLQDEAPVIHERDTAGHHGTVTAHDLTSAVDAKRERPNGVGHVDGLKCARVPHEAVERTGRIRVQPDGFFMRGSHRYRGKWRTCLASAEAGVIARDSGSVQALAWNLGVQGWAHAHLGDVEVGENITAVARRTSRLDMTGPPRLPL
jgi:hypothetical protein